jgi:tetratricopeptide (TPR) repeat protein
LGGVVPQAGPGGRLEFTFQQLLLLRTTRGLLEAGIPARRVRRIWSSLRRQLSDDLPLTSIRILANGDRAVAWDGKTSWQPDSGQFLLDFDAGEVAAHAECEDDDAAFESELSEGALPVPMKAARAHRTPAPETRSRVASAIASTSEDDAETLSAEQWFHLACELEAESPVEARQAYLQAVAADPEYGDAHLNLGRLFHEAGELGKAEAHYRDAVRCTPDEATYHFNLAVLLEDRGRPDEAILAYERAIACDADSADAHYNLGLLLEAKRRSADAVKHLMIARQLYASVQQEN